MDGNPNFFGGGGANTKYMAESMVLEGKHGPKVWKFHSPHPYMKSWRCNWVGVCYLKLDSWVWYPLHYAYRHSSCCGALLHCWNRLIDEGCKLLDFCTVIELNDMKSSSSRWFGIELHCCEKKEGENTIFVTLEFRMQKPFLSILIKLLIEHV